MGLLTTVAAAGGLGAAGLFCRIEGRQPLREYVHERRLRTAELGDLDRRAAARDAADVVVGLTTIPSRLPYLAPTIKSLLDQTVPPRRIVLHLPSTSRREGRPYPTPTDLVDLSVVSVERTPDYGPATKILPRLLGEAADQAIVAVDDDRIYRPTFIEDLVGAAERHPDAAVGYCGLRVPADRIDHDLNFLVRTVRGIRFGPGVSLRGTRRSTPTPVDVLHGYGGFLVRPRFFDLTTLSDLERAPEAAWYEDDTWFAAHCRAPKLLIPGRPASFPRFADRGPVSRSRLGAVNRDGVRPHERNTTILMQLYSERWSA